MATPNFTPRVNNEGNIGTSLKSWLKGWFVNLFVSGDITDGTNTVTVAGIKNQIDNPSVPDANQIPTDNSGKTVQDLIDDLELISHTQNTDTSLDAGGINEVSALEITTHIADINNPHNVIANQISTDDSGITLQDKIDSADSHIADTNNPHSVDKTDIGLSNVDNVQQIPLSYLDTDDALTADSDSKVPSQSAVKSYIDALLSANDAMLFKGVINCSGNPNYPAGDAGDTYRISVAGLIGGASGISVEVGDIAICVEDATASGDQATVGQYWGIIQANIDGSVVAKSPFTSVAGNIPKYNGITGRIIEDSGVAVTDITGHIADTNNPHDVIANQITTDDSGKTVQDLIDDLEIDSHTHTNKAQLDLVSDGDHDVRTDNPHNVTADQIATDESGITVQDKLDTNDTNITELKKFALTFVIDGGGSAITTGIKGDLYIPEGFDGTINKVTLLADQSGSIVIDIWKDSYANFAPTVADTITASAKPTISSAIKSQDATLTGWTKTLSAGDILRFNIDSATTIQRVTLTLEITRS